MSGKVFGRGQQSFLSRTAYVSRGKTADLCRIFAESPRVADGGFWIGVNVSHGKEIPLHSDSPRLAADDPSKLLGELRFSRSAKGHGMRKWSYPIEPHGRATFKVGSHNQGDPGLALEAIYEHCGLIWLAFQQKRAVNRHSDQNGTKMVTGYLFAKLLVVGVLNVDKF